MTSRPTVNKLAFVEAANRDPGLSLRAKHVLILLALTYHNGQTGRCDPSIDTLAEVSGCKRTAIKDALAELSKAGWITWERRSKSSAYSLNFGKVAEAETGAAASDDTRDSAPLAPSHDGRISDHLPARDGRICDHQSDITAGDGRKSDHRDGRNSDHKPGKLNQKKEGEVRVGANAPRRSRGSPLPDGWTLSPADFAFAEAEGLDWRDVNREIDRFRDHWRSKGEARADWSATWRNWIRREVDDRKWRASARNGSKPNGLDDAFEVLRRRAYGDVAITPDRGGLQ